MKRSDANALWNLFERSARAEPSRPILRDGARGGWITFRELRASAVRLREELRGKGLRRNEILMLASCNRPEFIIATLAGWALGATVLPVPGESASAELDGMVNTLRPSVLMRCGRARRSIVRFPRDSAAHTKFAACIRLTSGTTGAPRGAVMGSAHLLAGGDAIIRKFKLRPDDINLGVVPLNHAYGFDHLILPLIMQGTAALLLEKPHPPLIVKMLRTHRSIVFAGVPYLFDLLARQPGPRETVSGLRLAISAGAPLSVRTAEAFRMRYGVGVHTFYGSSECGGIAYDASPRAEAPEGCVGTPLNHVRISIDRRGFEERPRGEGRIVVESPAVGRGYLPEPAEGFAKGRFRTSDLGRIDRRGRLWLTGRISAFVNVSGEKVNPAEIERALLDLPGVRDAAAAGVKDDLRGERLEAWIVLTDGWKPERVRAALATALSAHKVPKAFHVVARIPRTERGKIDFVRLNTAR